MKSRIFLSVVLSLCTVLFGSFALSEQALLKQAEAQPANSPVAVAPSAGGEKPAPGNDSKTAIDLTNLTQAENKRKQQVMANGAQVTSYLQRQGLQNLYGIYFADLTSPENQYSHNPRGIFAPASTYKVPLAMVALKSVERGKFSLDETVRHMGKQKTLRAVLGEMIQASDNDAMAIFEGRIGGYEATQKMITTELGAKVVRRGQETTVTDLGKVWAKLDPKSADLYLSKENTALLIDLLLTVQDWLRDRIPAGVNDFMRESGATDLKVAAKIGTLEGIYEDTALIFGKNSDYILIILNKGRLTTDAQAEIRNITKLLLRGLE